MINWLKKFFPTTKAMKNSTEIKGLKPYFKSDCFWARDQQSIARGVAAGLAGAVLPGFQIFYAAILVMILRGNLAIALLSTFITNPLTVAPISYFIYWIGTLVIANGDSHFTIKDFNWGFYNWSSFWANVTDWLMQFGKPFLIGLPIVSLCLGLIGYFGTILVWNGYVLIFKKKRKR
jgi:uncharacterized protein (DUF2062 family)